MTYCATYALLIFLSQISFHSFISTLPDFNCPLVLQWVDITRCGFYQPFFWRFSQQRTQSLRRHTSISLREEKFQHLRHAVLILTVPNYIANWLGLTQTINRTKRRLTYMMTHFIRHHFHVKDMLLFKDRCVTRWMKRKRMMKELMDGEGRGGDVELERGDFSSKLAR